MKRFGVIFLSLLFVVQFAGTASYGKGEQKQKNFNGRIINAAADYLEIKKGRTECTIYYGDKTTIIRIDGSAGEIRDVRICQRVRVAYIRKEGKNIALSVVIEKESDCVK